MKISILSSILFIAVFILGCKSQDNNQSKKLVVKKWDILELTFQGLLLSEDSNDNPFLNYRLNVEFSIGDRMYKVPGFFAADGNSSETGATEGRIWKVKFRPDEVGDWSYKVCFRKGENIAIEQKIVAGTPVAFDGEYGQFLVVPPDHKLPDLRAKGRLRYNGKRYLNWAETNEPFLKGGADSPENFLAYAGFDDTYSLRDSLSPMKTYSNHIQDWTENDPTWKNGKGKGIIGAINYLSSKGMNSIYFLTMNINGDGSDVWPYTSPNDFTRFDCSKLEQWEIVFSHMERKGIMLHVLTQETENELLLDNGNTEFHRQLYYRELIARFGHHLALVWNLGEENGINNGNKMGQSDEQRKVMASFFKKNDPYKHPIVIHTWSREVDREKIYTPLLGFIDLDGPSLQVGDYKQVHYATKKWIDRSSAAGKQWFVCLDENGHADSGAIPDANDPYHDSIRTHVLWANLMAGGAGVEWYFGYKYAHSDLSCEDWRSRDNVWVQTKIALDFFQHNIPFEEMEHADSLVQGDKTWCFSKPGDLYLVYHWGKEDVSLDLSGESTHFEVRYFNPKNGMWADQTDEIAGGSLVKINTSHLSWKNTDVAILLSNK